MENLLYFIKNRLFLKADSYGRKNKSDKAKMKGNDHGKKDNSHP